MATHTSILVWFYFFGLQNHCGWWLQTWSLKDTCSLEGKLDKPRQFNFADKSLYSETYGFAGSYIRMWKLDLKKAEWQRIDAFKLWCWRRLLRVPWNAGRFTQSILKEISPEYSLEGLMLKLKLQYFGHLMRRANSLEKTLMLAKIEDRRRREQQSIRWLDGITD